MVCDHNRFRGECVYKASKVSGVHHCECELVDLDYHKHFTVEGHGLFSRIDCGTKLMVINICLRVTI